MENSLILILSLILKPFVILCGYMISTNSFPQPLSQEDEQKYIKLCGEGDDNARRILIEHNLRLVAHIVKKYYNTGKDIDDLISIGTIGLIKGVSTFKPDKGVKLSTYAARCIENEILMVIRSTKNIKSEMSINEPMGIDNEGNEINLLDILGTEMDDIIDEVHLRLQVKKLYCAINEELKDREKVIVELRYGLIDGCCKTQREIAAILGISRSYVSRIETRALNKLNKALMDE